jgi:hypothetical protein
VMARCECRRTAQMTQAAVIRNTFPERRRITAAVIANRVPGAFSRNSHGLVSDAASALTSFDVERQFCRRAKSAQPRRRRLRRGWQGGERSDRVPAVACNQPRDFARDPGVRRCKYRRGLRARTRLSSRALIHAAAWSGRRLQDPSGFRGLQVRRGRRDLDMRGDDPDSIGWLVR